MILIDRILQNIWKIEPCFVKLSLKDRIKLLHLRLK